MRKRLFVLVTCLLFSQGVVQAQNDPFAPENTYLGKNLTVDPVNELLMMQQKLGSMFDAMIREGYMNTYKNSPAMDFRDLGDRYVAQLDMPGMTKDAINVDIKDTTLTVSGSREEGKEESNSEGYFRKERSSANFKRVITLPGKVKVEAVDAKYENGVLTLTLPKLEVSEVENKKIEVK